MNSPCLALFFRNYRNFVDLACFHEFRSNQTEILCGAAFFIMYVRFEMAGYQFTF